MGNPTNIAPSSVARAAFPQSSMQKSMSSIAASPVVGRVVVPNSSLSSASFQQPSMQKPQPMHSTAAIPDSRRRQLEAILQRFEISIVDAQDLTLLEDYRIMVIADDSGSMNNASAPPGQRVLGQKSMSRWQELQQTLSMIVQIGACLDPQGVDLYFLNRPGILRLQSADDPRYRQAFATDASGSTPLTRVLLQLAAQCITSTERPILLVILTDGEPDEGACHFTYELRRLVKKENTRCTFRVQIMACTDDDSAVGWLNAVDDELSEVDVTDDYHSEMLEVLKRRPGRFTRGDWCMKALLGPVSQKFDDMDSRKRKLLQHPGCCSECVIA